VAVGTPRLIVDQPGHDGADPTRADPEAPI
jgi:hypothetical protein